MFVHLVRRRATTMRLKAARPPVTAGPLMRSGRPLRFRTGVDLVSLSVTVTSGSGGYATDGVDVRSLRTRPAAWPFEAGRGTSRRRSNGPNVLAVRPGCRHVHNIAILLY